MTSDTPRTDNHMEMRDDWEGCDPDFTRTLEREGNTASAEIEALRTVLKEIHSDLEYLGHAAFCESVMFFPGICTCGKAKAQAKLQHFLKP